MKLAFECKKHNSKLFFVLFASLITYTIYVLPLILRPFDGLPWGALDGAYYYVAQDMYNHGNMPSFHLYPWLPVPFLYSSSVSLILGLTTLQTLNFVYPLAPALSALFVCVVAFSIAKNYGGLFGGLLFAFAPLHILTLMYHYHKFLFAEMYLVLLIFVLLISELRIFSPLFLSLSLLSHPAVGGIAFLLMMFLGIIEKSRKVLLMAVIGTLPIIPFAGVYSSVGGVLGESGYLPISLNVVSLSLVSFIFAFFVLKLRPSKTVVALSILMVGTGVNALLKLALYERLLLILELGGTMIIPYAVGFIPRKTFLSVLVLVLVVLSWVSAVNGLIETKPSDVRPSEMECYGFLSEYGDGVVIGDISHITWASALSGLPSPYVHPPLYPVQPSSSLPPPSYVLLYGNRLNPDSKNLDCKIFDSGYVRVYLSQ
ncbi:hypothetical protein DRN72_01970 [Methanosarcinales archaeon]|nr:MAG: hypothetical protein DRN72_01970 [Methanosarcinales archaeon]